jgi:hypothetical protein
MFDVLAGRFELADTPDARAAFEAALIASDAIAAHAFVLDPHGSQRYLELGAKATRALLAEYFG